MLKTLVLIMLHFIRVLVNTFNSQTMFNYIWSAKFLTFYLFVTPKIAQSCSNQVKLRVEFTLLTLTVKDPLMFTVTCTLTVEDGPCFREDKMAR